MKCIFQKTFKAFITYLHTSFSPGILYKGIILILIISLGLPADERRDDLDDESGPEIIPASILNQREMTEFLMILNSLEPQNAAGTLAEFVQKYELDPESRPESPRNVHEVIINDRRFAPEPGIDKEIINRIDRKSDGDYTLAYLQLEQMPSLNDYMTLAEMGIRGLFKRHWIGPATYVVAFPIDAFKTIVEFDQFRWLGYYPAREKMTVPFSGNLAAVVSPVDSDLRRYRTDLDELQIRIIDFDESIQKYIVSIQPEQVDELAELWWVRSIDYITPSESLQDIPDNLLPTKFFAQDSRLMVSAERLWQFPRTGEGIRVGLIDTNPDINHPDFAGNTFLPGTDSGLETHGTHVAGIIAARNPGISNISGAYGAQGMAPDASLYAVDLFAFPFYPGAFIRFRANDIRLSNHSWGFCDTVDPCISNFNYNINTRIFDRYVRNNDEIIILAAGNDGPDPETIGNPATGKNVISVGAVNYVTDDDRDGELRGGTALYSSRGPVRDIGRLKPDLVAPGGHFADYGYHKYGVVSLNPALNIGTQNIWPEATNLYLRTSGTSMAAPHVTGAAALMLEKWNNLSSEALKARLIGTTIPINAGGDNPLSGYANTDVGYGLLNAYNAAGLRRRGETEVLMWKSGTLGYINNEEMFPFAIPADIDRLIFVLAYNDRPGGGGELIYDLELVVSGPGGNNITHVLPEGVSSKSAVQKIVIEDPFPAPFTATVRFTNPGVFSKQDYSLFIYAVYKTPELSLVEIEHPPAVGAGDTFTASMTVENIGGWIAAGLTGWVSGSQFDGEVGLTKNLRNLMFEGDNATVSFELETLPIVGEPLPRFLNYCADAVNKDIEPVCIGVDIPIDVPWVGIETDHRHINVDDFSGLSIKAHILDSDGRPVPDGTGVIFKTNLGKFGRVDTTHILEKTEQGFVSVDFLPSDDRERGVAVVTAMLEENENVKDVTKIYTTQRGIEIDEVVERAVYGSGRLIAEEVIGGSIKLDAYGYRTITASRYSDNPAERHEFNAVSNYVDIHFDRVAGLSSVEVEFCSENFITSRGGWNSEYVMHFWNGSEWVAVSNQEFDGERCSIVNIDYDSVPGIRDLAGAVFAAFDNRVTSVADGSDPLPYEYRLIQNYPNPFNPSTNIRFALPETANVKLEVFDIVGRLVATLVDDMMDAGYHTVQFDGSSLSSGIYLYRMQAGAFTQTKRLLLMK